MQGCAPAGFFTWGSTTTPRDRKPSLLQGFASTMNGRLNVGKNVEILEQIARAQLEGQPLCVSMQE